MVVGWSHAIPDMDTWRATVNIVINFRFHQTGGNFWIS